MEEKKTIEVNGNVFESVALEDIKFLDIIYVKLQFYSNATWQLVSRSDKHDSKGNLLTILKVRSVADNSIEEGFYYERNDIYKLVKDDYHNKALNKMHDTRMKFLEDDKRILDSE